jgi:hypothetical protein
MLKRNDKPRALVVSFNHDTGEILYTDFDGDSAADSAVGWAHPESFVWRDFPASDGWDHFAVWNEKAGKIRGERVVDDLLERGAFIEKVPT